MISFIIIGRNEGWKLSNCIQSILDTIDYCQLKKYEIIYVDSNSIDNSIERAKEFDLVKIFKIKGDINAAIARNIGAKVAMGDVYFFIDGDMEIIKEFLPKVYSAKNGLIEDFVSGHWINYYYNHSGKLIEKEIFKNKESDSYQKTTGGLFLIDKKSWGLVGGMNINFKNAEDHDLGLRLALKGIFLLRKKEIAAIHHTIAYLDKKRMWQDFFNWNHLYSRSLLYRTHVFNRHVYERIFRSDYSIILLISCIVSSFFLKLYTLVMVFFYFAVILFRGKFKFRNMIYFFLRDLSVLVGLFIFFPKERIFTYREIE